MARPGGNPALKNFRNSDTTAANYQRQHAADLHVVHVYARLQEAAASGAFDDAEHEKAAWRSWLNANGHLTPRGRPWSKKALKRMLKRLRDRQLVLPDGSLRT